MMDYDDAITDRDMYALWAAGFYQLEDLQDMNAAAIRAGGFTIPPHWADELGTSEKGRLPLADFLAHNTEFQDEDREWQAHCRRRYDVYAHPSLTASTEPEEDAEDRRRFDWRHRPDDHGSETAAERNSSLRSMGAVR